MVGCRTPLGGIASFWVHKGKIQTEYRKDFWHSGFLHTDTNKPIACGDPNHARKYDSGRCCSPEENPILCEDCLRKYGYIW